MIQVRPARPIDQSRWDEYVLNHPHGLAYHLFAWGEAVKEAYGFAKCYLMAEEGGRIVGVMPMVDFHIPFLGTRFISLPYCDIGGFLVDNDRIRAVLHGAAQKVGKEIGAKTIEIRQSNPGRIIGSHGKVRMILDLPESSEILMAGFKSKLRSQIKKPIKDGLIFQLGGAELAGDFYRVFCENMRDLGSPVHSRGWIDSIVKQYGNNVRVGIVRTPNGVPLAGGIVLFANKTVSIPWASSLLKYKRLTPNMLLYWGFLSFAADGGFSKFDFGRSSIGGGTYKFKEQWGAKPLPLEWMDLGDPSGVTATDGQYSQYFRVLRKVMEEFWRRMPAPLTVALGPKLRRIVPL